MKSLYCLFLAWCIASTQAIAPIPAAQWELVTPHEFHNDPNMKNLLNWGVRELIHREVVAGRLPEATYQYDHIYSIYSQVMIGTNYQFDVDIQNDLDWALRATFVVYNQPWTNTIELASYVYDVTQPTTGSTGTTTTTPPKANAATIAETPTSQPSSSSPSTSLTQSQFVTDSLNAHNFERNAHGIPSVTWSPTLAASAQAYSKVIASTGKTSHSTDRVNVGENLAWERGPSITVTQLAGLWISEKQYYIPGQDFPDVSTTGSWSDVAHYTQLMWEKTTEIGCGETQAQSGWHYYVCRYSPQGNINGEPVYSMTSGTGSTQPSITTIPESPNGTGEEFILPVEEDLTGEHFSVDPSELDHDDQLKSALDYGVKVVTEQAIAEHHLPQSEYHILDAHNIYEQVVSGINYRFDVSLENCAGLVVRVVFTVHSQVWTETLKTTPKSLDITKIPEEGLIGGNCLASEETNYFEEDEVNLENEEECLAGGCPLMMRSLN